MVFEGKGKTKAIFSAIFAAKFVNMLAIKIKAGSITNLTDARYFAAWEVEWLGFNLSPGEENAISPMQAAAIREWVEGPKIVGEFSLSSKEDILHQVKELQLDAVQVGMFTDLATVMDLSNELPVIKEIVIEKSTSAGDLEFMLSHFSPHASCFLLNFDKGGFTWAEVQKGEILNPETLLDFCQRYPILLGIGVQAIEVKPMLEYLQPLGLNLMGGEEEKTGIKSYDDVDDIFEQLSLGL
jgi:phosphoribosylanthranilate isomerase